MDPLAPLDVLAAGRALLVDFVAVGEPDELRHAVHVAEPRAPDTVRPEAASCRTEEIAARKCQGESSEAV